MPERPDFEIRFPVVEGYVVALQRNQITADVAGIARTKLNPATTPTAAFVKPQVGYQEGHISAHSGFGFDLVDREEYYRSMHLQTIEFVMAREIVRVLTEATPKGQAKVRTGNRRALFPQVLRIVQKYFAERVDLAGLNPCELGLQTYSERIVGLLTAAIVPDDAKGESPLLPRLNRSRPIDTTARVHFKTVKPVQATLASHLNFVACDTNSWEQAAAFQLDKLARDKVIECYARNDRLEFNIPYELYNQPHFYEPDFLVRVRPNFTVVLEIKGRNHDDTEAKHQAAQRWLQAVNHWGQLGRWYFLVCRDPQQLGAEFLKLVAEPSVQPAKLAL